MLAMGVHVAPFETSTLMKSISITFVVRTVYVPERICAASGPPLKSKSSLRPAVASTVIHAP